MTWEIALGIFALVAFVISICKIVSNNTQALTEIKVSLEMLNKVTLEQKEELKTVKEDVSNHETRITVIENERN